MVGDDDAEHPVAEKFEPLIGAAARRLGREMGQRQPSEVRIAEAVAEPRLEIRKFNLHALVHGRTDQDFARHARATRPRSITADCRVKRKARSPMLAPRRMRREPRQCTRWKMRPQRTSQGQRQISQAGVSSPIEKKMISPRPIRFSNGT